MTTLEQYSAKDSITTKVLGQHYRFAIFLDFRLLVMLKYFYIGAADICFWWSVWLLSDLWFPLDISKDGAYSFLRGYLLILTANFLYLAIRNVGGDTFNRYWEDHNQSVYPSAIVTRTKVIKKKSYSFYLLKSTFSICIYVLVVGFIQIWRGLFASFDYLISTCYTKFNVIPC